MGMGEKYIFAEQVRHTHKCLDRSKRLCSMHGGFIVCYSGEKAEIFVAVGQLLIFVFYRSSPSSLQANAFVVTLHIDH